MRKITISDAQSAVLTDANRVGPDAPAFARSKVTTRALHAKGLVDVDADGVRSLTEDGKDVARQLQADPRRRTFHIAEADDDRVLRVQPSDFVDNIVDGHEMTKRPYPFFVRKNGAVLKQDFWLGTVARVIGFQADLSVASLDLKWTEVWADPQRAVGMYLITSNESGDSWSTHETAVESITVEGAEHPGED